MPLKISNPTEQVAVLNKWADGIEAQLRKVNTHVGATNRTAVNASNRASVLLQTNGVQNGLQSILNLVGTPGIITKDDGNGTVEIQGDGITHGDINWPGDAGFALMRDDFTTWSPDLSTGGVSTLTWGDLGWQLIGSTNQPNVHGGAANHPGQIGWQNNGTANQFGALLISPINTYVSSPGQWPFSMALLENPGWKLTWVFKFGCTYRTATPGFDLAKKSFYIGLAGCGAAAAAFQTPNAPRPNTFLGLRFDKSITPGTLALASVANASGGNSVYTLTASIPSSQVNSYIGMSFTVAGFVTGANNGTFTCIANTSSTITLNNASGAAETHAATAAGPAGPTDTVFNFEYVSNPIFTNSVNRNNKQGTVQATSQAPTQSKWHRLDITCLQAGVVTMTLDGSSADTVTLTIPKNSYVASGTSQVSSTVGFGRVSPSFGNFGAVGASPQPEFGEGSAMTVSGLSGGNAALNGTWILDNFSFNVASYLFPTTAGTIGNNSVGFTTTGWPALTPFVSFGNDDEASPVADGLRLYVDFFSFVYNPSLGSKTAATVTATNSRFF